MKLGKTETSAGIQQFQQRPDVETLASFQQFSAWPHDALALLSDKFELQHMRPGSILFELGANDQRDYFLLDGQVDLVAEDGRRAEITAGSDRAQSVISRLRPRKFKAEVVLPTVLISIDRTILSTLVKRAEGLSDMRVLDVRDPNLATNTAYLNFTADLSSHKLAAYVPADLRSHLRLALEHASAKVALSLIQQDAWLSARFALLSSLTQLPDDASDVPFSADALRQFVEHQPIAAFRTPECEVLWRKRHQQLQVTAELAKVLATRNRMPNAQAIRNAAMQAQLGELALIYSADQSGQSWTHEALEGLLSLCGPSANQLLASEWKLDKQVQTFAGTDIKRPDESSDDCRIYALARLHALIDDESEPTPEWHTLDFFEQAANDFKLTALDSLDLLETARGQVELRIRATA